MQAVLLPGHLQWLVFLVLLYSINRNIYYSLKNAFSRVLHYDYSRIWLFLSTHNTSEIKWTYHRVKGINITLHNDDTVATRKRGEYYLGYVFTGLFRVFVIFLCNFSFSRKTASYWWKINYIGIFLTYTSNFWANKIINRSVWLMTLFLVV